MDMNGISLNRLPAAPPPRRRPRRWRWLAAAPLAACLAAACTSVAATGGRTASAVTSASAATGPPNCAPPGVKRPPCYSPRAYQVAYGVAPLLSHGIDGRGETVVVPELSSGPPATDIRKDLATFDRKFALAPATLHVVNTIARSKTPYLADDEEVEDTEMVHAIAPGAILDVVLVPQDAASSSASVGEHFFTRAEVTSMHAALQQARDHHVTFVASSGDLGAISDDGPPRQVSLPASDPLVLAVGGTMLGAAQPTGSYLGEMAWNGGTDASGGGYSKLFPRPAYQDQMARIGATRGVPDVAANADSATAMVLEYSDGELRAATGTSASTPLWAGVIALADQEAGRHLGFVNPAIYAIARGPAGRQAFHDVVTGDNSVLWPTGVFAGYNAGPGWDPVTGWGSPDAQYLVPLLAHAAVSVPPPGPLGRSAFPPVEHAERAEGVPATRLACTTLKGEVDATGMDAVERPAAVRLPL
jgi:subtilase family serine protease